MPPKSHRGPAPLSDLLLERFALGELPPDRLAAIQARVDAEPALQERLRDLRNEDRAIRMQHPPRMMAAAIRAKAGVAAPKKRSPWAFAAPALAMAAAALLVVQFGGFGTPDVLPKGNGGAPVVDVEPVLQIVREDDGPLHSGDRVSAGDVLGFRYDAAGYGFGALFSIDGAGVVTLHMPEAAGQSLALEEGLVTLDLGYELDDAPDFERFFLVLSEQPFDLSGVLDAARDLAAGDAASELLAVGEDLEVVDFLVDKDRASGGDAP